MSKMTIIQLLNKIANGEPVEKFKYNGVTYCYTGFEKDLYRSEINEYDFDIDINSFCLNSQVEIIEEDKPFNERVEEIYNRHIDYIYGKEDKKIEKIPMVNEFESNIVSHNQTRIKINEIIDYLNKEEE